MWCSVDDTIRKWKRIDTIQIYTNPKVEWSWTLNEEYPKVWRDSNTLSKAIYEWIMKEYDILTVFLWFLDCQSYVIDDTIRK